MNRQSELAYRQAAAEGASHIGLLLVVYDALADNLQRAAQSVARKDIATRCNLSNHSLTVIGHLESWVSLLDEAALRESLTTFYSHLRGEILRLQAVPTPEAFEALARDVRETRAVWQQKETSSRYAVSAARPAGSTNDIEEPGASSRFSWSA